jgi:hypothetical protein
VKHPDVEQLKRLTLRAIVAYAVRWAQRVRPAFALSEQAQNNENCRVVDGAIAVAIAFSEGNETAADPQEAMAIAVAAASATGNDSRCRFAARAAALAAETLAHALGALNPSAPPDANDAALRGDCVIDEPDDPLTLIIDCAATAAHSAAYSARFVLKEFGIDATAVDDYVTLLEQSTKQSDRIGATVDIEALGTLWCGAPPDWRA